MVLAFTQLKICYIFETKRFQHVKVHPSHIRRPSIRVMTPLLSINLRHRCLPHPSAASPLARNWTRCVKILVAALTHPRPRVLRGGWTRKISNACWKWPRSLGFPRETWVLDLSRCNIMIDFQLSSSIILRMILSCYFKRNCNFLCTIFISPCRILYKARTDTKTNWNCRCSYVVDASQES